MLKKKHKNTYKLILSTPKLRPALAQNVPENELGVEPNLTDSRYSRKFRKIHIFP